MCVCAYASVLRLLLLSYGVGQYVSERMWSGKLLGAASQSYCDTNVSDGVHTHTHVYMFTKIILYTNYD